MIRRLLLCTALVVMAACGKDHITPALDAGLPPLPSNTCLDVDGDGIPGTGECDTGVTLDCDDNDPFVYPGAPERCNGRDDSCEGDIDEGLPLTAYYEDLDGDGVGSTLLGAGCRAGTDGGVTQTGDCDDTNPRIRPGQAEICNGVDDDCDGTVDNGLPFASFYPDVDGDGFGDANATPTRSCLTTLQGQVTNSADCDDANQTVKPGATELCNRVDDNCDGQIDNGITYSNYFPDVDGDGFGDANAQPESACTPVPGKVTSNSDCDDANQTVKPGAPEVCNGADDDCDGQADEGLAFTNYYPDLDGDGFGDATAQPLSACTVLAGRVTDHTDCNDANPMVKPSATELCNGVDDDCAGGIDNGLTFVNYYPDADGDGFGASGGTAQSSCQPVPGKATNHTDCNDANPGIKPGAPELCNAVDDNCNGQSDEGLTFVDYYPDADGDGHGSSSASPQSACAPVAGRVTSHDDCNDGSAAISPDRVESCNQVDDNCNGQVDEGLPTSSYYVDADGDGYGSSIATAQLFCGPRTGFATSHTDCNDQNAAVNPGVAELCNNVDDNCDGQIDNGVSAQNYYPDADGDGFGQASATPQSSCSAVPDMVTNNLDCNDANPAIKPTASEVCNGLDDNCNGATDEGLTYLNYYVDADTDGYGASGSAAQNACAPVSGRVTNNQDCNDANAAVHPGATEVCNGLDDDCVGGVDNGLPTQSYYTDADGDGYGSTSATAQVSCSAVSGKVTNHTDCNDANNLVHPGVAEACNGVDDNCNGQTDEGNPGGGASCSTGQQGACATGTRTCQAGALTCVATTTPTAETCNGLDDNCNGTVDEGFTGLGTSCSAGVGACLRSGTRVCAADHASVVCNVDAGAPTAAACDGVDNDCDGVVDEPVLTSTTNLSTSTAWTDVEVQPFYYSSASCAGGTNGTGTDVLAGGAVVMAGGSAGITLQRLDASGAPTGGSTQVSALTYSDVAFAQAGNGFVVAGVWSINNAEIDLYYADPSGTQLTYLYTQFKGASAPTLDSLRVVRGNGKRVTLLWREAGTGIRLARVEPCYASGTWTLQAPGCTGAAPSATTLVASTTAVPGLGADSNLVDWTASQSCVTGLRRVGVAYLSSDLALRYFSVQEDGTAKTAEVAAYTVSSPRALTAPDVTYFRDAASNEQYFVAYVTRDSSSNNADLNYWLTSDQTWHYAYLSYGTVNGVSSILRPRTSATATNLWMSAVRYDTDASGFTRQVMTRTTDLAGARTPLGSSVEFSVTSGACGADPACRPGDKQAFTNWAPFSRLYYSASGASPVGAFASTLTCN